jgi:hypothetical protein
MAGLHAQGLLVQKRYMADNDYQISEIRANPEHQRLLSTQSTLIFFSSNNATSRVSAFYRPDHYEILRLFAPPRLEICRCRWVFGLSKA